MKKRIISFVIAVCMILTMIPVFEMDAKAVDTFDYSDLDIDSYVTKTSDSNSTNTAIVKKQYIKSAIHNYIENDSTLKNALLNNKFVVFCFEGGSDNATSNYGFVRTAALLLLVQNINGTLRVVTYDDKSNSIPDQPMERQDNNQYGAAYGTSGSDTCAILNDGVYTVTQTTYGGYNALLVDTPGKVSTHVNTIDGTFFTRQPSGILMHYRFSEYALSNIYGSRWSIGCINVGTSGNAVNTFVSLAGSISSTGYLVLDRQLYLNELKSLYNNNTAVVECITAYSTLHGGNLPTYTIHIDPNGGTSKQADFSLNYGATCTLSPSFVERKNYYLKGWNLYRPVDKKWFVSGVGWRTASEIQSNGYTKCLYDNNLSMTLDNSWLSNCSSDISGFNFVAVWTTEAPSPSEYMDMCTPYASYFNIKIIKETNLKSLPCSWDTNKNSETIHECSVGETYTVTRIYQNNVGNYWYETKYNGQTCYVFAGDTLLIDRLSSAKIDNTDSPSALNVNDRFWIKGDVYTKYTDLYSVTGRILKGGSVVTVNGKKQEKTDWPSNNKYSLNNSAIDAAMLFNELPAGVYQYVIEARESNYFSDDGKTLDNVMYNTPLHSNYFTVGSPTTYNIHIDSNGGTSTKSDMTLGYGEACNLSSSDVSRTGYTLKGWNLYRPVDQKWFVSGIGWKTASEMQTSGYTKCLYEKNLSMNIDDSWLSNCSGTPNGFTFYAVWEPNTYTIKYNANGGSGTMSNSTHTYGSSKALSANTFTRTGYSFLGWSTNSSATYATYSDKQSVSNLTSTNGGTVNLYAVWKANTYYVKYNANGGSGTMSNSTHTYGSSKALSANVFTRNGYTFLGWSTDSNATSATYSDKQSVSNLTSTNGGTVNLYAVWKANTYTVKYNANGGEGSMSNSIHTYGIAKALSANTFTRTGYTFLGWSIYSSATSAIYSDKQSVNNITSKNGETVNLYAVWTRNTYIITYDANGGFGEPEPQNKIDGEALWLSKTTPTRTGYIFCGWSKSKNSTEVEYSAGGYFKENADTTLYAVWEIACTVTFDANGGTFPFDSYDVICGKESMMPEEVPEKEGYIFVCWETRDEDNRVYLPGYYWTTTKSVTLYAVWE